MKHQGALAIVAAIVLLCVSATGAAIAQEQKETVKIAFKKGVGKYLTNSDGAALYSFKKDSPGKSECVGPCEQTWHAYCYRIGEIEVADGLKRSDFGSFHQKEPDLDFLTYKGRPLYNYTGDQKPGDTNGHGIDGQWFLATP